LDAYFDFLAATTPPQADGVGEMHPLRSDEVLLAAFHGIYGQNQAAWENWRIGGIPDKTLDGYVTLHLAQYLDGLFMAEDRGAPHFQTAHRLSDYAMLLQFSTLPYETFMAMEEAPTNSVGLYFMGHTTYHMRHCTSMEDHMLGYTSAMERHYPSPVLTLAPGNDLLRPNFVPFVPSSYPDDDDQPSAPPTYVDLGSQLLV
jgi:hypothetical protein